MVSPSGTRKTHSLEESVGINGRRSSPQIANLNNKQFDDASDDELDFELPVAVDERSKPQKYPPLKVLTTPVNVDPPDQSPEKASKKSADVLKDSVPNSQTKEVTAVEPPQQEEPYDFSAQQERNYELMLEGLKERMQGEREEEGYKSSDRCESTSSREDPPGQRMQYADTIEIAKRPWAKSPTPKNCCLRNNSTPRKTIENSRPYKRPRTSPQTGSLRPSWRRFHKGRAETSSSSSSDESVLKPDSDSSEYTEPMRQEATLVVIKGSHKSRKREREKRRASRKKRLGQKENRGNSRKRLGYSQKRRKREGAKAAATATSQQIEIPPEMEVSEQWRLRFNQLQEFKAKFGHANPCRGGATPAKYRNSLGLWLGRQRCNYRKGVKLSNEQVQLLRDMGSNGFGGPEDSNKGSAFRKESSESEDTESEAIDSEDTSDGSQSEEASGSESANTSDRSEHDECRSNSSNEQVVGGSTEMNSWEARFLELYRYKKQHGHANPTRSRYDSDANVSLSRWLYNQRRRLRLGRLTEAEYQKLYNLGCAGFGGESNASSQSDNSNEEMDSTSNEASEEEGSDNEQDSESEKTPQNRNDARWNDRFHQLKAYKRKYGHPNPTRSIQEPDIRLGQWLKDQRQKLNRGLYPERVKKLHRLGCTGFGKEEGNDSNRQVGVSGNEASEDYSESEKESESEQESETERTLQKRRIVTWHNHFVRLQAYKRKYGHANPTRSKQEPDIRLGQWLKDQRQRLNRSLYPERFKKLCRLGCEGFEEASEDSSRQGDVTGSEASEEDAQSEEDSESEEESKSQRGPQKARNVGWDTSFNQLQAYKKKHLHANPTFSKIGSDANPRLGKWLSDQRWGYRNGRLIPEKARLLHDLGVSGFGEESDDSDQEVDTPGTKAGKHESYPASSEQKTTWDASFKQLQAYKKKHLHANPSFSKIGSDTNPRLGKWLSDQRWRYRKDRLVPEKARMLRELGVPGFDEESSDSSHQMDAPGTKASKQDSYPVIGQQKTTWKMSFQRLQAYKKEHGHSNPTMSTQGADADPRLGKWLADQRFRFRHHRYYPEKARMLRKLGVSGFGQDSDDSSQQMSSAGNGASDEDSEADHDLESDRAGLDNSNEQASFPPKMTWEERFLQLQAYKKKHLHANPTFSKIGSDANPRLGKWLSDQRWGFRNGRLITEKTQRLRDLGCSGFVEACDDSSQHLDAPGTEASKRDSYAGPQKMTWEMSFQRLEAYKNEHGHTNPTLTKQGADSDPRLGKWLADQRWGYRNGRLVPEKAQMLRDLGVSGFCKQSTARRQKGGNRTKDSKYKSDSEEDVGRPYGLAGAFKPEDFKTRSGRNSSIRKRFGVDDFAFYK